MQAIKDSHAAAAIILPNDGNIFMAAEQAVSLADVPVKVVKTKTIQQGLTALVLGYDQLKSLDENEAAMSAMIAEVKSGSVTTSVRDTTINGLAIQAGDAIGLLNGEIVVAVPDANIDQAASELLAKMIDEDSELVTIYYGEDSTLSAAEALQTAGEALDDELEFEIHDGGQPLYPLLLSVE